MPIQIQRREFVLAFGGTAVAWPFMARAQQPAVPVIGWLAGGTSKGYAQFAAAFRHWSERNRLC
jgi:putative ABC transport system substrate-binding protein